MSAILLGFVILIIYLYKYNNWIFFFFFKEEINFSVRHIRQNETFPLNGKQSGIIENTGSSK